MKKGKFIYILLIFFIVIASGRIIQLGVFQSDFYQKKYELLTDQVIYGASAPRGRILDVNGKILVDNVGVNTIMYNRLENKTGKSEVEIAYKLGSVLKFDETHFTDYKIKKFYIDEHNGARELITDEEWDLYKKRKLSGTDLEALKYERIDEDILSSLDYEYKNASYIYSILSTGYYFDNKILKKNLSDEDVVRVNDFDLPGVKVALTWERIYPYGDTLRSIFGLISTNGVPKEYKEYYESKGISMASTVGVSALELQYDDYLRGQPAEHKIENGNLVTVHEEEPGADLYLSIDIDKQLEVENIMKSEMQLARRVRNTKRFNHSYVLVGNPNDGSVVAMAGLLMKDDHFSDITINVINSSYTVGSIVKGASMSVGYQQGLIEPGKLVWDSCIKVYNVPQKCSWTRLGYIDDLKAMAQSSNYYQFLIATKLTNPSYTWNSKLNATKESFDVYRNMFASYGLGVKTGIDLPNEHIGIIGKTISDDLLLNLSIGQYDTYTPIEIFQYINTIANDGERLRPSLMNKIVKNEEIILSHEKEVMGNVSLQPEQMKRVQQGFNAVMTSGLGYYYTNRRISSAGKTGTAETFVDTDADGVIDTGTMSTSFIMYAPYDNPEYTITILSPNISLNDGSGGYAYSINLRINNKITNYLFEKS